MRRKENRNSPDHQLVVTTGRGVVNVRSSEEIVGDVSADISVVVAPLHSRRDLRDIADQLFFELHARVRVGLDGVLGAGPGPSGVPGDTGVRGAVEGCALGAASRVHSPHVVVDDVGALGDGAVLLAGFLRSNRTGHGRGHGEDLGGLHGQRKVRRFWHV